MNGTTRSKQAVICVLSGIVTVGWGMTTGVQAGNLTASLGGVLSSPVILPLVAGLIVVFVLEVATLVGSVSESDPVPDGATTQPETSSTLIRQSEGTSNWNSRWENEEHV